MTKRKSIHVGSKWSKTQALLADRRLRAYVPDTRRFNENSLKSMLRRYSMVYIKPVSGTYGNGVMKVEQQSKAGGCTYSCHYLQNKQLFRSYPALYGSILRLKRKTPYLVQKGIHLLNHRGRPFDIRVMVQKNSRNRWEATGKIGRVAHPHKIVTNYHSGGKPTELAKLLKPYLTPSGVRKYDAVLSQLGVHAAEALGKMYPGVNMVGADIGVDSQWKPWIIELNTCPDPYIFKHLTDPSVFRKVLQYARTLGRLPNAVKTGRRRRSGGHNKRGRG
jgi:hypothetical protein